MCRVWVRSPQIPQGCNHWQCLRTTKRKSGGTSSSRLTSSCWPTKQTRWWLTCKVVTDVTIPADSKMRRKTHEELEKYWEMEKQREQMRKVKSKVIDTRDSMVCLTNWKRAPASSGCKLYCTEYAIGKAQDKGLNYVTFNGDCFLIYYRIHDTFKLKKVNSILRHFCAHCADKTV